MAPHDVPFLRTPAERFQNISDFPYKPQYLQYGNLRMAYIDEKIGTGLDTFLCLHGQPTWSYLYRKMIPILLNYTTSNNAASRRVVAPDMFGFGRSDKPSRDNDYTFTFHRDALLHFIRALNLTNITLVVQDWGGLLGLTLPIAEPFRFKRFIVMNTTIAVGVMPSNGFLEWRTFNNRTPDMNIGALIKRSNPHLSKAEVDAYDAPYPCKDYKGGVRRFPNLVPVTEDMEGTDVSKRSLYMYQSSDAFKDVDVFLACGMQDPVLGPSVMERLARVWRNGCYYATIDDAGHFVQEHGEKVAKLAIEVFEQQVNVQGVKRINAHRMNL
jgi:haloalkane dehalogenase